MRRREKLYRAYWMFAAERQRIFMRRVAGEPSPWTEDAILTRYRFTNPFRASDRESQSLIRKAIYAEGDFTSDDVLFRVVLFRLFSRTSTWLALERELGPLTRTTLTGKRLLPVLQRLQRSGPIYTNAFILCANNAFGYDDKVSNHVALLRLMFRRRALPLAVARAQSLKELYETLIDYPLIGPFMAYQLAIDVNYSELVDFHEDEFTVPGPGAERGIRKIFPSAQRREMSDIIRWVAEHQERECDQLGLDLPTLFGRRLHAIDCQNLFCEIDKYTRVAFPRLTSERSQIKSVFRPSDEPLQLFFPPKWQLNDRLPRQFIASTPLLPA